MLRTILKACLVAIIVAFVIYVIGSLLVFTNFELAVQIGELFKKFAPFVGIISGLWYGVNGGWTWNRE